MRAMQQPIDTKRYAKAVEVSKRISWDIDRDVIRGRSFDFSKKFLPDGLSLVDQLDSLGESERRLLSQVQGRTYANIFGLVERFIGAKILEISRDHWLGDQTALGRKPVRSLQGCLPVPLEGGIPARNTRRA
jgi:hypothetical protein